MQHAAAAAAATAAVAATLFHAISYIVAALTGAIADSLEAQRHERWKADVLSACRR
ncbi:MAG TPA: hypothetical protein VNX25_05375 [Verrucomicrobiae bacterium]|nr:hypothetical protein [Verrucomicrobiae bacterium]